MTEHPINEEMYFVKSVEILPNKPDSEQPMVVLTMSCFEEKAGKLEYKKGGIKLSLNALDLAETLDNIGLIAVPDEDCVVLGKTADENVLGEMDTGPFFYHVSTDQLSTFS